MESDEYPPMSGGNTISTATVLLDTGMTKMTEPVTKLNLDTPAGLVSVTADCEDGKCKAVAFDNVPAFVYRLDLPVDVPGLGVVTVDIAWGGMHYAIVDARSVGLEITNANGPKLIEVGERIKQAVRNAYTPVHPENDQIRGVTIVEFTEPVQQASDSTKTAINTVVVSPGGYDAVLPTIKGSAWITGFKQMSLHPSDPFPTGFRVGDQWHVQNLEGKLLSQK